MVACALSGARVLLDTGLTDGMAVVLEAGRIRAVRPAGELPGSDALPRLALPAGSILAPGFVDIQANGGGGILFNDRPDRAGMAGIARAHRRFGTTALLPTLITDHPEAMRAAAAAYAAAAEPVPGVAGLHLEGPFISPNRPGIHDRAHIRPIGEEDVALLLALAADPARRVVLTLAPECVPVAILRRLAAGGVILCAGHTLASPETIAAAVSAGLRCFTHLFNAMPPMAARDPGPAAAALLARDAWCGIIADGVHVHPAMLRLALAVKPNKVFLVTDSMPPLGTDLAGFALNERPIRRAGGRLLGADGTLAGADLDMAAAVRNAVSLLGVPVAEALAMASRIPAEFLRLDHERGHIRPGYRADLVLLSAGMEVLDTCLGGRWGESREESPSAAPPGAPFPALPRRRGMS